MSGESGGPAVPEASAVVPSHGDAGRLRECLAALRGQTLGKRLQVVVSLDGGPPLPPDVSGMAELVVEGPHAGPAAARNRGWRASSGRYVLFTDSDCLPSPDWAERLVDALAGGADGVKGAYSSGGEAAIQRLAQVEFEERYRLLARRGTDLVDTYSAGFTRRALEAMDGFDESFPLPDHEDVDLSYRMKAAGMDLRFEPEALVRHRHRDTWIGYFRTKVSRGRWRTKVLRRFPRKVGGGAYTPLGLKAQIALCALLPAAVVAGFLTPWVPAAWVLAFLASTVPLVRTAASRDPKMAPLVPPFALWRGVALLSGLVAGIFAGDEGDGRD